MQSERPIVALVAQPAYCPQQLDRAVAEVLAHCGPFPGLRSLRVLLKPNLITARNGALACTDGRFIAAAARWFIDRGARVAVGDGPAFGSARSVLSALDAWPLLQPLGVEIADFGPSREVVLPCGHKAVLAAAALECDLLVNLPKVKVHQQMRVTLAMKNYFGCVSGLHKPWWHMAHGGRQGLFVRLLLELPEVLPASCSLVDGITAMHVTGPIHGQPYPLGVIGGSRNPVAMDTALLAVLGIEPAQSPLWLAARQAGMIGARLDDLLFPLAAPWQWQPEGFRVPEGLMPIRFNPLRFVGNFVRRALLRGLGR